MVWGSGGAPTPVSSGRPRVSRVPLLARSAGPAPRMLHQVAARECRSTLGRMSKPPIDVSLVWQGHLTFEATSADARMTLDCDGQAGPSPVQALAMSLAGCMAIDVVDIITKGRHLLTGLSCHLVGQRREEIPRYFTGITLHFVVSGHVPKEAVQRAIDLSHEKYCSVWHSLRQDIDMSTTFEIRP